MATDKLVLTSHFHLCAHSTCLEAATDPSACLPFNIKSARKKNCEAFGDIRGAHVIVDDVITDKDDKEECAEI